MKKQKEKKVVIYQAKNGALELRGDFTAETLWASQAQIAEVFGVERSVVTKHINNVVKEGELDEKSNVQILHIANSDKPVKFYSLDTVLAVGYRINSKTATEFRKWATKTLKQHITKGFTINRKQVIKHYDEFIKIVSYVQTLLPVHTVLDPKIILDLVKEFAGTWMSLDAYDKDTLVSTGATKKSVTLHGKELTSAIQILKTELMKKGEATDVFASERQKDSIMGIVGNVMQSFGGQDVYKTVEEKAAHLLYFVVKNHPFTDGNKRSGAYSFIWFLKKTGLLARTQITPPALTAITLIVAESDPAHKDKIIRLILQLLKN